jgi:homocitrate synthase
MNIIDTTLREGLQSPILDDAGKFNITLEERGEIFSAMMEYGVVFAEVFSPNVNQREAESLEYLINLRDKKRIKNNSKTKLLVHCRCHRDDINAALNYDIDGLNIYMGTSEANRTNGHGKRIQEIIKISKPLLKNLRKKHPNLLIRFSGEDAFRTNIADLYAVYDEIVEYVDRLGTPDTVGVATPAAVVKRIDELKKRYPKIPLEGHFHNDRGFSMINAVEAMRSGMEFIQTSIMGLGERSGITSLTGLIFNLSLNDVNLSKKFKLDQSYALNVLLANILKIQVPTTEPVSLTNRTHSAGVHTSAMLHGNTAYEAHNLSEFGVNNYRLLLGPLSGKHIVKYYLTHVLNYVGVTDIKASEIAALFKNRSQLLGKNQQPVALLSEIAREFKLAQISKPVSHQENLDPTGSPVFSSLKV